jgi:hypothetical protein
MSGQIHRKKERWGVLLTANPFGEGSKFADMRIEAEIARPPGGRGAVGARYSFSRLPIAEKFSPSEMIAWTEAQRAIMEAAKAEVSRRLRVVEGFEADRKKSKTKRSASARKKPAKA